ncbi:MAG: ATP-binding cassette, subfamily B, bacterial [Parcubacteria bacterium C7867-007]|nr:MAG: ATP-binding cassette, subfamily B, bacterial [Parcubacteria bacterium C7867-007]
MYSFLKDYKWRFLFATLLRIIGDVAWLYPAYGMSLLVNYLTAYQPGTSIEPVLVVFSTFVGASVLRFGGGYWAKSIMFSISERIALDSQRAGIAHMFELDIGWHEAENTGNKLKRISRGGDSMDRVLRIWINNFVPIAINLIGIVIVLWQFDTGIAFVTAVFICLYYGFAHTMRKQSARAAVAANLQDEQLQGTLFESLNNVRTVKVLGMAPALMKLVNRESNELYKKVLTRIFWFQTSGYSRGFFAYLFQTIILGFIVWGIIKGEYEVGFLVLFAGYFGNLIQSIGELADIAQDYVVARLSVGRLFQVLHEEVNIDRTDNKLPFPSDWKKITFENVSFGYGDSQVLKDVSFEINRGEKIGIVGLSGAGKSTLFKLLLKEYESYEGSIRIDDVLLSNISRQDYFNYSAVVLQDTEVFNLSLRENVVLANSAERDNQHLLEKAIRVAHVKDFMSRLPLGIETPIGEKGVRLSGGERQRVGIARAVFKNPQLLLLDEATSHLDIESEEKIRSSLHEFFQSVTAVVIAHRLTTIREMDRIIVMEGGKILESGSFDQLHKKKGRFYELWEKQNL